MKLWWVMTQLKGRQVLDQAVHMWNTVEWWWGIKKVAGSILHLLYSLQNMCPGELVLWFICLKVAEKGYERDYILNFNKPLVKCSHSSSTCIYQWGCMNTLTKIPQDFLSAQEIWSHTLWEDCLLPYTFLHPQKVFSVCQAEIQSLWLLAAATLWLHALYGLQLWPFLQVLCCA